MHVSHNGDFNHDISSFIEEGVDPGTQAYLRGTAGEKTAAPEQPPSSRRLSDILRELVPVRSEKTASRLSHGQPGRPAPTASPDSVVGKPRRTQKGNIVPDPAPAPPSEQQPLGPIDPSYSFNTPDQAKKKWSPMKSFRYAPDRTSRSRPQRGVPGADKELTRKQWYDNAMSQRYNKGQISEQEYQQYIEEADGLTPLQRKNRGELSSIFGGAKQLLRSYGQAWMKGTSDTAGTAADRTLEGSGN